MKVNKEFILREIADEYILVPTGKVALKFNGLITVNEVGALIWEMLLEDSTIDEIVKVIIKEYDIDEKTAKNDAIEFIEYLMENQIIEK